MAHLTRITVKLLLIVAVTMQPTVVLALKKGCSAVRTSQVNCPGCGCCAVETVGDRCGCCSGHAESSSDSESISCCGHGGVEQQLAASPSEEDLFAGVEHLEGASVDNHRLCCTDENLEATPARPAINSTCRCLQALVTPYAPVSRSPAKEVREIVSLGFDLSLNATANGTLARLPAFGNASPSTLLHFAQINLCVWRL